MHRSVQFWQWIVVGLTLSALLALAAGISSITFERGNLFSAGILQKLGSLLQAFRFYEHIWLVFLVVLPLFFVWMALWRRRPPTRLPPLRRNSLWITLLQLVLFVAAFFLLRRRMAQEQWRFTLPAPPAINPSESADWFQAPQVALSPWVSYLITVLLFSLLLAWMFFLWRRQHTRRSALQSLALEAQGTLEQLSQGAAVYPTIVQCYRRMVQTVQRQRKVQRAASMTAHEFIATLVGLGLPSTAVHRLTQLFEKARYSDQPEEAGATEEAQACLGAIVEALGGER